MSSSYIPTRLQLSKSGRVDTPSEKDSMFFKNDGEGGEKTTVPALPLRDIIVFPHMVSQLFVGREKSIAALDDAMTRDKEIFLVAQKNRSEERRVGQEGGTRR